MKGSADSWSNGRVAPALRRTTYCGHDGAREIRIYSQYADANTTRLRAAGAATLENLHLSRLYAIPGGWGWTICRDCRLLERAA